MNGPKLLFVASWVLLLLVSAVIAIGSLWSLRVAYFRPADNLSRTVSIEDIRSIGGDEAVQDYRGRRATAATWALGYAILSGLIAAFPYRRGERWSWWALFLSMGLSQVLSLARVVALGATLGAGTAGSLFAFFLLALLAGMPRMFFLSSDL